MTLSPILSSTIRQVRALAMTWVAAAFLPLPVLLTMEADKNAVISCLYLGLASAWLATEIFQWHGLPESRSEWCAKMLTVGATVFTNAALFIALGVTVGVYSSFPFPLMAALSAIPAIGLVPWLIQRVRDQFAAMILGALILLGAKLSGCVVARLVYGPNYEAQGYIAGDWQTAKLMITLFWLLTIAISLGVSFADYWRCKPDWIGSSEGRQGVTQ